MITTTAPGKLVLSGEYAVLDGAPAVAMAVDWRARVLVDERATEQRVRTMGFSGDCRIVDAVCEALGVAPGRQSILLDTAAFADDATGAKYGLGSSAALSVALTWALGHARYSDNDLRTRAYLAHRAFQQGIGSGVDVACALDGGLICFQKQEHRSDSLIWPAGLHYAVLWSGVGASTQDRVAKLSKSSQRRSRQTLFDASVRMAEIWGRADVSDILIGYDDYIGALRHFDIDHGLGVFEAGHDALAAAAKAQRLVYKPCGAGGGDAGIIFGDDEECVRRFAITTDFERLDVNLDPDGVLFDGGIST